MSSVQGTRGVVTKKSSVVKQLPADLRQSMAAAMPAAHLQPVIQPFNGLPSSTFMTSEEKKEAAEQQANPLLHPDQTQIKKKKKAKASAKQPISGAPSEQPATTLRLVRRTDNMRERDRTDVLDEDIVDELYTINPIFEEYRVKQDEIESANPYQLEGEVFTPINRRTYYRFIDETYSGTFKIPFKPKGPIDEDACKAIEESKRVGVVTAFSYQKFISEYLRQASPYRGLLVYHGLGSGKTCSAIAAAEALYGTANKRIIVMTPFSLRPNFISEITFCGFKHFNVNNHWVSLPLATVYESTPVYLYAQEILSLSDTFLRGVLRRPEEERRVIWIPDFDKPANFNDDKQITPQDRIDIRQQINDSIENRITFISYNGITASKLKEYACTTNADGKKFFDDAVIVVDEIHNLIRLMHGNILPYITKRSGRARKISVEPIVPGRWKPTLCDRPLNYKRAYLFYRLLTDARNSKIIGLSGTPIINFPEELGILANVLSGYMECAKFVVDTIDNDVLEEIKDLCELQERVDIVRYEISDKKTEFLVSVFNEGYIRGDGIMGKDEEYVGVRYTDDEEGQETIQEVYAKIKEGIQEDGLSTILSEEFVSYPRLPVDDETFRQEFINPMDLSIRNRIVLQKRITGMISYYAANNEAFMPRIAKDELVRCEMSDFVLGKYTVARKDEIAGDANKKIEQADVFRAVEMFAKMQNPSSYRFRSRALCNFAFPESIERPFPGTVKEEEEAEKLEIGEDDLADMIELASAEPLEDAKAIEEVMAEEEAIEDPDYIDPSEPVSIAAPAVAAPASEEVKQEGGADEEGPKVKRPMTKAQLLARMEELRAVKKAQEEKEEKEPVAPIAPIAPVKKVFGKPAEPLESAEPTAPVPVPVPAKKVFRKPVPAPAAPSELTEPAEPAPVPVPAKKVFSKPVPAPSAPAAPSELTEPAEPAPAPVPAKKVFSKSAAPSSLVPVKKSAIAVPAIPAIPAIPAVPFVDEGKEEAKDKPVSKPLPIKSAVPVSVPAAAPAAAPSTAPAILPVAVPAPEEAEKKQEPPKRKIKRPVFIPEPAVPAVPAVPAEPEETIAPRRRIPYKELIMMAMQELNEKRDSFMNLDAVNEESRLSTYSTKLDRMIRNILNAKGSNLVYSQFKTVEGLGVLGIALKANGFTEIVVQGGDADPSFSPETIQSLSKGPAAGEKRFISFTGEGSKERRGLILNIFNGNMEKLPKKIYDVLDKAGYGEVRNTRGAICWVIGITGAGAEGISLKCCRAVHIMESYWNNVRLDQVKGRAIRICSHTDLPYAERDVEIYTYCTIFSEEQKKSKMDITLKVSDNNETSDERVYNVSIKKDKINQAILDVMKEAAVDCGLNSADVREVQCFRIDGRPDQYLFDPDLEVDKRITGIQFKHMIEAQKSFALPSTSTPALPSASSDAAEKAMSQPSAAKPSRVPKMNVELIQYDGKQYLLFPHPGDKQRFKIYSALDQVFTKPLGEGEFDPIEPKRVSRMTLY